MAITNKIVNEGLRPTLPCDVFQVGSCRHPTPITTTDSHIFLLVCGGRLRCINKSKQRVGFTSSAVSALRRRTKPPLYSLLMSV